MTIKNSETGEYQWIFVAAEDIKDVTKDHKDDLVKFNCDSTDAEAGYVYEIKLRPEMKWQDGTPINADTYVYSMKAFLDPTMKNYRANNYYSGESAIAGADDYFFQGSTVFSGINSTDGETTTYAWADLVKGADGVYTTPDGAQVAFGLSTGYAWMQGNSLADYYGAGYIPGEGCWDILAAAADDDGNVPVTDETIAALYSFTGSDTWGNETQDMLAYYLNYAETWPEFSFDKVGLYKVDEYTIRYVCQAYYDYYYFLTSCTSNWIVHEELYEKCKDTSGELTTSTYGTSLDKTMSYGPYKIAELQDEKQMVFVQNENYWEYTKDDKGNLSSMTFFEVDGAKQPQYQTQKIVIDVMTDDAAKQSFMKGELDDWTPAADEVVEYSTSEQLYQVDETYTMRLFFNHNLDALKKMDQEGNQNSVVLSNYKFRQAMSLALDRSNFVTATAGYKPAYSLINSLYFYDVYNDPASIYRNTEEAMQAVCNIYGVKYGEGTPYADLKAAYESITGYNLTEAKALMTEACKELVDAGLYKEGEKIVIKMGWKKGANDSTDQQQITLLNNYLNEALKDTGFGKIELQGIDNLNDRYKDVASGVYAIGWGAWGGAAFYPFTMFRVYCDPSYTSIHEAGCWDPATEKLTLTIDGEEVTMTWQEWSTCMTGAGKYAEAKNETKLQILAAIEENYIELYHCIPVCATTVCSMLSYKMSYYTENYSIMYGFGGMRLLKYNYSDAEWAKYVADQGGTLSYT
jgi:oligopeptide transport system substrate-binding protein